MKEVKITMDGHPRTEEARWVSYEDLVWMHYSHFPEPPLLDPLALGINFIITYEGGAKNSTGTVRPKRKLRHTDGMSIKVMIDPEEFKTQQA